MSSFRLNPTSWCRAMTKSHKGLSQNLARPQQPTCRHLARIPIAAPSRRETNTWCAQTAIAMEVPIVAMSPRNPRPRIRAAAQHGHRTSRVACAARPKIAMWSGVHACARLLTMMRNRRRPCRKTKVCYLLLMKRLFTPSFERWCARARLNKKYAERRSPS